MVSVERDLLSADSMRPRGSRTCSSTAPGCGRTGCALSRSVAHLALRLGARGRYVEVPQCGHAILPEQPEAIARAVIAFLDDHAAPTGGRK